MKNVAVIVGSLRRDSLNLKLAKALAVLAEGRLALKLVEIGDLPLYNEDLWENPPASVLRMKREVQDTDAVLFVTPEYNRSFSPAIKNVIDWGTRPYGQNVWADKPAAIIGTSPGAIGTAVAQNSLKGLVTVCGMTLMGQPEAYVTYREGMFDASGAVADARTGQFLAGWIGKFADWIDQNVVA